MAVTITGGTAFPSIGGYDFAVTQNGNIELTITGDTWVADVNNIIAAFNEDWKDLPGMESDVSPASGFNANWTDFDAANSDEIERLSDTVIRFNFTNGLTKTWLTGFQNDVTETITIQIPAAAQNTGETQLQVTNTFQINPYEEPASSSGGGKKYPFWLSFRSETFFIRNQMEEQYVLEYIQTKIDNENEIIEVTKTYEKPKKLKIRKIKKIKLKFK